jgi:hypothetical protein
MAWIEQNTPIKCLLWNKIVVFLEMLKFRYKIRHIFFQVKDEF